MTAKKNALYSIIVLAAAGLVTALLVIFKPKAEKAPPTRPVTTIEAVAATAEDVQLTVLSQGTVRARTRTTLAAEVGGLVTDLSPNFRGGRFFKRGEILVQIDTADYMAAAAAREADVATARLVLAEERALAEQARRDWERLGEGEADPLVLRQPQLERARANLQSAQAASEKARRDLERTAVRAPYDGRVERRYVDLGQLVAPGPAQPLAEIFATDTAEVRLPLSDREAGYLDLSAFNGGTARTNAVHPAVRFTGTLNGVERQWAGRVARIEATIDPQTRFFHLVAEVDNGFAAPADGSPPLQPGLFVEAEIDGRSLPGAFVLPRRALRSGNHVYVVTDEAPPEQDGGYAAADPDEVDGYLRVREVEIAQANEESVVLTGGLGEGERVAVSPIAWFVEGMPVRITESP